jgi:hypothetical protein
MAYSPQEKAEIVAQVAAKVAGSVCCGSGDLDKYLSTVETVHNDLMERIAAATATAAATVVTQVFPGATVSTSPGLVAPVPVPAPAPAPAPVPSPAPQGLVGPITGASGEDDKWRDALVNSPDNWFNNINDKRSPDGPDFRHKTLKDKDGKYNLGLWIKSDKFQTRAPDWVFQQLGLDIPAGYNAH